MGLDVTAISRAMPVGCRGGDECDDSHYCVSSYRKRKDGLKAGCYVIGNSGRSFGFRAGTYAAYYLWRQELTHLLYDAEPEDIWDHPRRYQGKPFVELIDFPDGVGPVIGPKTSAKLFDDFVAFASRARKHFLNPAPTAVVTKTRKRSKGIRTNQINSAGLQSAAKLVRALGGSLIDPDEAMDFDWMWEVYRDFRRAFKLARDRGFVVFG